MWAALQHELFKLGLPLNSFMMPTVQTVISIINQTFVQPDIYQIAHQLGNMIFSKSF